MPETHTQFLQKLNVQTGIIGIGDRILEQVFLDSNLDGALVALFLNPDPDLPPERIWYPPPHYAVIVRRYLDKVFPNRWIGRRGQIERPARSPDLNSPRLFFMGIFQK
jgi:hypothetical protein